MRIIMAVVLVWLVIGVVAVIQRGYLGSSSQSCAHLSTVAITVVAGVAVLTALLLLPVLLAFLSPHLDRLSLASLLPWGRREDTGRAAGPRSTRLRVPCRPNQQDDSGRHDERDNGVRPLRQRVVEVPDEGAEHDLGVNQDADEQGKPSQARAGARFGMVPPRGLRPHHGPGGDGVRQHGVRPGALG